MGRINLFSAQIRLRYVCADISELLSLIDKEQIAIRDVSMLDELTLEFTVRYKEFLLIRQMASKRGDKLTVVRRAGIRWPLLSLPRRPLLVIGVMILLIAGVMVPSRILFVDVEGDTKIPRRMIIDAAQNAGIKFGANRRKIRSEQVKNRMLDELPGLKWVGVNTYGSKAIISVRERDERPTQDKSYPVCHIIASRDGVIVSTTVTSGFGICAVGQAVRLGDILISGYTDCGICIRANEAKGEVMAATNRKLRVITPAECSKRIAIDDYAVRYSLIIGKKRINFYKGSGILGSSCGKMLEEYVLKLPGDLELPVSLLREQIVQYDYEPSGIEVPEIRLKTFASNYLDSQMLSGKVIDKKEQLLQSDQLWILEGQYACIEDIGIRQDEKIGDFHGKADGTDRERRQSG